MLEPQLLPGGAGSSADTASAEPPPAAAERAGLAGSAGEVVCPNGNPACLDRICRNPNCGVGKRGNKKAQAAKPRAAKQPAAAAASATGGPLRMRSAQRYPLSYPRRYHREGNQTEAGTGVEEDGQEGTRICEFHNYAPSGCRKGAVGQCPLSHSCCHFCGVVGHRALECEAQLEADARVLTAMALAE